MTTIECPWCDEPVELELSAAHEFTCETCRIGVDLAPDPVPAVAAAA